MAIYPTLLDMAKRNGRDRAVPLIEETSKWIPEISGTNWDGSKIPGVGSVRTIKGINYKTLVRTANPTVGFRDANTGANVSGGSYENRLVETFILNPRWECDKAVADRSEDGPDAYIADEAMAIMEAAMQALGSQFFYGRAIDAKGFPGLVDAVHSDFVVDATGTGSSSASVYAVKFGIGHVQWIYGENGSLAIPDKRIETVYRADPGTSTPLKPMDAYVQSMLAYPGVQVGSLRSVGRIKNITASAGKTLTDALIYSLLTKMKVRPDVLFMNKTLLEQLRASRTTFSPTGLPAPTPNTFEGIPIAPTESLTMTEVAA